MLQQTQVARVIPHYERFVAAFPTPAACARASAADVVRLWSGLGYNRRALNLHRAAQSTVAAHGGRLPADEGALRALPGVGAYTARAVRSFGFGDDVAAVDTNGVRVLARCGHGAGLRQADAFALGDRLVPPGRSWDFNQAMFDLGATVCRARPACDECPLQRACRWKRANGPAWPVRTPWRASPTGCAPSRRFEGSDRQGPGPVGGCASVGARWRGGAGRRLRVAWRTGPGMAKRVAAGLVADGVLRLDRRRARELR